MLWYKNPPEQTIFIWTAIRLSVVPHEWQHERKRASELDLNIWARWRLKSPASRLFTQLFIQAQIKENIKAPRHWPLWGEFTGDWWIAPTKGQ